MKDHLLLFTAVMVPILPLTIVGMAACFWLYSRHSLRRRKCLGETVALDANECSSAATPASDNCASTRRGPRPWPLERKGKATLQDMTADDIKGLSKEECLFLFRLLPPATLQQLHGEWQGEILAMGMSYPLAYLLWHWRLGRGWWLGKGVDQATGCGYNVFYNQGITSRSRRFDAYTGLSAYEARTKDPRDTRHSRLYVCKNKANRYPAVERAAEDKDVNSMRKWSDTCDAGSVRCRGASPARDPCGVATAEGESQGRCGESLHLVYARHNDGLFHRLHEEIRFVHDGLFLGFGSLGGLAGRTPINSIPFLLVAPNSPLKLWDRERN